MLLALAKTLVSHEYLREIETRVSPRTTWCSRGLLAEVATPVAIFVGPGTIAVTVGEPVAGPVSPAWTTAAAGSLITSCWASRSEEHTSELQSLMRISYAVFCLKKKNKPNNTAQ